MNGKHFAVKQDAKLLFTLSKNFVGSNTFAYVTNYREQRYPSSPKGRATYYLNREYGPVLFAMIAQRNVGQPRLFCLIY
jgi:hypothetical protein